MAHARARYRCHTAVHTASTLEVQHRPYSELSLGYLQRQTLQSFVESISILEEVCKLVVPVRGIQEGDTRLMRILESQGSICRMPLGNYGNSKATQHGRFVIDGEECKGVMRITLKWYRTGGPS